jgi:hypothetical protein
MYEMYCVDESPCPKFVAREAKKWGQPLENSITKYTLAFARATLLA